MERGAESLEVREARRLALAKAGLLSRRWCGLPRAARGRGKNARAAVRAVIDRFGYLQLDTVSIAGARSHAIVLLSRLRGLDPDLPEELLQAGTPYFEYWGHEASWLPLELYPTFAFRRQEFRTHPWFGNVIDENRTLADDILELARSGGPFRSSDLEGSGAGEWWGFKLSKRVAAALWSCGELAIAERRSFQRTFDLTERVIPREHRYDDSLEEALPVLLLRALDGHGWATTGTLASTWRLRNLRTEIQTALRRLVEEGEILPCSLRAEREVAGWIRPSDLELARRLRRIRPQLEEAVLLSPFDPVLWDRARVQQLFGFEQVLEIFKPAAQRKYGYYCLPVLAGGRLIARYDLKADRAAGRLSVLSEHMEPGRDETAERTVARAAVKRYAEAVRLSLTDTLH